MSGGGEVRRGAKFVGKQVIRPRAQVEEQIKEAILSGQFVQGDKLPPETQLAEQFGVSRPTVREALGALVSAGFIRKVPGVAGGSFVNSVTTQSLSQSLGQSIDAILRLGALEIEEIGAVRHVLEIPAASLAAEHRGREHLRRLEHVLQRQRSTTIDGPDIPSYDIEFHTVIGQASGNRLLSAFISALRSSTSPVRYLEVTPQVATATARQHMAIHAAITERNAERAGDAMAEHLDYVTNHSTNCSWMIER